MKRLISLFFPLLLLLVNAACGDLDADPNQDWKPNATQHEFPEELYSKDKNSYGVTCHWYTYNSDFNHKDYGTYQSGYEWGTDKDGYALQVTGKFRDGFLVADKLDAPGWIYTGKPLSLERKNLNELCQKTIHKKIGEKAKLLHAMASKYTEVAYDYPIVFPLDENHSDSARVVIFGDSLSDTGNLKRWLQVFPESPYFAGRFSNGFVWVDYLQRASSVVTQNWSYGGATSYDLTDQISLSPAALIKYVTDGGRNLVTGNTDSYIKAYISGYLFDKKIQDPKKTVFVIWTGANDYGSKFDDGIILASFIDYPEPFSMQVQKTTDAIVAQMDTLYQAGARRFVMANLPNLGITPLVATNVVYHAPPTVDILYSLSVKSTALIVMHNDMLSEKISAYAEKHSDAEIVVFDVFDALQKMIDKKTPKNETYDYGFDFNNMTIDLTNGNSPKIVGNINCYQGGYLGVSVPNKSVCSQVKRAMFYDKVHPTTFTQCWLGYFMQNTMHEAGFVQEPDLESYHAMCDKGI